MKQFIIGLSMSVFVVASPLLARDEGKIAPSLEKVWSSSGGGSRPVVVLLWSQEVTRPGLGSFGDDTIDAFRAEARRAVEEATRTLPPGAVRFRYESFSGFAANLDREQIERLSLNPSVRMIVPDVPATFHRAEGNPLMKASTAYSAGHRGAGVTVAVIDDGVDYTHPELGGGGFPNSVVVGGYDFEYKVADPSPAVDPSNGQPESHGTSVAGIVAGRGDSATGGRGVAPEAKIVGLRVTSFAEVLAALDWVATNRNGVSPAIRVVNMSLGFDDLGFYTANCDGQPNALPYRQAVDRLEAAGIVVVASSGNENWPDRTSIPSCLSSVLSVGAVYDANIGSAGFGGERPCNDFTTAADQVTCYSNSASFLSVLAPSHNARTPKAGGGYDNEFGGTSAAAPYAAGAVALMISANPSLTPAQYRSILKSSGRSIRDAKSNVTTPRVDADAAIRAMSGGGGGGGAHAYFVPAAARLVGGGGLFFQSDLRILNRGSASAGVVVFLLSGNDNSTALYRELTLAPGQNLPVNDAIRTLFGLDAGGGALLVASTQPLRVTSNLYTTNNICPEKGGTFGQFIDGAPAARGGTSQRVYHLIHNASYRTNFGVVNTSEFPTQVQIRLIGATGTQIGSHTLSLGPYGWAQVNRIFDLVGAGSSDAAYAIVSASQPVISYASVVDNRSGDAFYIQGEND